MRTKTAYLLFMVFFIMGCKKNEPDTIKELTDGFCIMSNDKVVPNHNDFDYYDYSTHMIYLKEKKSFDQDIEEMEDFTVFADGIEIYTGQTFPSYSSYLPSGPVIRTQPSLYGDFVLPIGFTKMIDSLGNPMHDPRSDIRIIEALKNTINFMPD